MTFSSFNGAWYSEYNRTNLVKISRIVIKWDQLFANHDSIWQTTQAGIDAMVLARHLIISY